MFLLYLVFVSVCVVNVGTDREDMILQKYFLITSVFSSSILIKVKKYYVGS